MHILIVDDIEETAHLFAWGFSLEGHSSVTAINGVEAVELARQGGFDAIVMDLRMPGMDGVEATRQIRALPHGQEVPIVIITAAMHEANRLDALEAGADRVVNTPILPQFVLKHIEDLLKQESGTAEAE